MSAVHVCYVDESGGVEDPSSHRTATPVMVILGLVIDHRQIASITMAFLQTKRQFFPGAKPGSGHHLDYVLAEVKGSEVRASLRSPRRDARRQAIGYLDKIVGMLTAHQVRLVGRVWVKAPGATLDPRSSYTSAIQDIARHFEHYLDGAGDPGFMVCDNRMVNQNAEVSHSIFTQKHRVAGDPLPRLVEAPTFGQSGNHVGLQLADLVASALVFPLAARTYCAATHAGVHVDPHFDVVKKRFGAQLRPLQHRYQDSAGRWRGGIVVSDAIAGRPGGAMFG